MRRELYIDNLKAFAIFLVVWGHSLQFLRHYDYPHNMIFEFIYSFHMPLFFLISGFLFKSSINLHFWDVLKRKSLQLLLPSFIWNILYVVLFLINNVGHIPLKTSDILLYVIDFNNWPFWFLTSLFFSYLLVYAAIKLLRSYILAFFVTLLIVLLLPPVTMQRYLLPFFWIGIFMNTKFDIIKKNVVIILLVSGLLFGVLLAFWDGSYIIYIEGFPAIYNYQLISFDFSMFNIVIFRLLIGLLGSIFFFLLFYKFINKSIHDKVNILGRQTLGIYILQSFILEKTISKLIKLDNINIYQYTMFTILISVLVIVVSSVLIKLISKNYYSSVLLIGKLK